MTEDALIAARRISTIVDDLRTFHKVDSVSADTNVNETIAGVIRLASPKIQNTARVERDLGLVPNCWMNAGRFRQVLLNLIVNAAQAMPEDRPASENVILIRPWSKDDVVFIPRKAVPAIRRKSKALDWGSAYRKTSCRGWGDRFR